LPPPQSLSRLHSGASQWPAMQNFPEGHWLESEQTAPGGFEEQATSKAEMTSARTVISV
jgi:hypothetical protein